MPLLEPWLETSQRQCRELKTPAEWSMCVEVPGAGVGRGGRPAWTLHVEALSELLVPIEWQRHMTPLRGSYGGPSPSDAGLNVPLDWGERRSDSGWEDAEIPTDQPVGWEPDSPPAR